jgi:1-acyl-sn-glycerol-3-phosphate acyltransferase
MYQLICLLIYTIMAVPLILVGLLFVISVILAPSKMNTFGRLTSISVLKLLFINFKIKGTIPKDRPMILMFNHSSFIDPFLFAYASPGKTTGITAVENYKYPVFGWMLKKWRAIPIDRSSISKAKESIQKGEEALKDGYNVIVLPEGTRTMNGKIRKFKKGGFHMAVNINAPILPIGSKGAYEFKPKNRWYIKPGPVTLNVGEIIEPEEFEILGINGLTENVRDQLQKLTDYELES